MRWRRRQDLAPRRPHEEHRPHHRPRPLTRPPSRAAQTRHPRRIRHHRDTRPLLSEGHQTTHRNHRPPPHRRPLLRPRHAAAKPGHQMEAHTGIPRPAAHPAAPAARDVPRRSSNLRAASSTRPAASCPPKENVTQLISYQNTRPSSSSANSGTGRMRTARTASTWRSSNELNK